MTDLMKLAEALASHIESLDSASPDAKIIRDLMARATPAQPAPGGSSQPTMAGSASPTVVDAASAPAPELPTAIKEPERLATPDGRLPAEAPAVANVGNLIAPADAVERVAKTHTAAAIARARSAGLHYRGADYAGPADWHNAKTDARKALADAEDEFTAALSALATTNSARDARQQIVADWCAAAFGADHASSPSQRGIRLVEEAIETAQACGCERGMVHKLIDYIFDRPAGTVAQELGGVGVTLLALAQAASLSADKCEADEIARVLVKPLSHFTERNKAKNDAGFNTALPAAPKETNR